MHEVLELSYFHPKQPRINIKKESSFLLKIFVLYLKYLLFYDPSFLLSPTLPSHCLAFNGDLPMKCAFGIRGNLSSLTSNLPKYFFSNYTNLALKDYVGNSKEFAPTEFYPDALLSELSFWCIHWLLNLHDFTKTNRTWQRFLQAMPSVP